MSECLKCGTTTVPGEAFCSNCGTKNPPAVEAAQESEETTLAYEDEAESGAAAEAEVPEAPSPTEAPASVEISGAISTEFKPSVSLGGKTTGEVPVDPSLNKHTVKKGNTGGHQPTVKQLDPSSVLNSRYEIVRRIGGGGMGAVYLAKDRPVQ